MRADTRTENGRPIPIATVPRYLLPLLGIVAISLTPACWSVRDVSQREIAGRLTNGYVLVHAGAEQVQSFKAPADRIDGLRVRAARTLAVPRDSLRVEIREPDRADAPPLAVAVFDSEISGLTRYFKWLAADIKAADLRAGSRYELVFSSKTKRAAPWLVNCFYEDVYADGAAREGYDIVFEVAGGGRRVTSVPKGVVLDERRELFGLGPDGSDLHVKGEKPIVRDFGPGFAGTGAPYRESDATTTEALCRTQPDRVKLLFAGLDLERAGLQKVRAAVRKKDWPTACDALIEYYRHCDSGRWLRVGAVPPSERRVPGADMILEDTFVLFANKGKYTVPRNADGGLDWGCLGPLGDKQWRGVLSRHGWFGTLVSAWQRTGNPEYARYFDRAIRDWVLSNPCRADGESASRWVTLDVGLRMHQYSWPRAFYALQQSAEFTPAARILMLQSVLEHATLLRRFHSIGSNWSLMELYGLACVAYCWPEFKDAPEWRDHAAESLARAMQQQLYPDGSQTELTSGYHEVVAVNCRWFADLAEQSGRPVPRSCIRALETLRTYQAGTMRPHGTAPLNNDSGRMNLRAIVKRAAERFRRPDWLYIATNGAKGEKPKGEPSRVFPWAGHVVMRSGWDRNAHWSFFDIGPYGTNHQHRDKLHLSVSAYGRDLLVDGGVDSYMTDRWRRYFVGSAAHNVILVDGAGQGPYAQAADRPATRYSIQPGFDFARGAFADSYQGIATHAVHQRGVVYLRGIGWIVVDRVAPDRPCRIQALWHYHPACTVAGDGLQAVSTDPGKGNLRIVPAGGPKWELELIKGRTKPSIQGWYSPGYNQRTPAATAVYAARITSAATFAWVLIPARGILPAVRVNALAAPPDAARVRMAVSEDKTVEIAVRLAGDGPVELSGGLELDGDCAVLGIEDKPLVAGGRILDNTGRVVVERRYGE